MFKDLAKGGAEKISFQISDLKGIPYCAPVTPVKGDEHRSYALANGDSVLFRNASRFLTIVGLKALSEFHTKIHFSGFSKCKTCV